MCRQKRRRPETDPCGTPYVSPWFVCFFRFIIANKSLWKPLSHDPRRRPHDAVAQSHDNTECCHWSTCFHDNQGCVMLNSIILNANLQAFDCVQSLVQLMGSLSSCSCQAISFTWCEEVRFMEDIYISAMF